jgi:hypothetical protein
VTHTVTAAPRPSSPASAAAAPAGPAVSYSCHLGFAYNDAPPLLPLTEANSNSPTTDTAFQITFKNTSHQDVTLHNVTEETVSPTGQQIDSQTVGQTSSVNPGSLPFLLAPGEHITMLARFGDFPSTVNVSTATYLHSHCVVTGWN